VTVHACLAAGKLTQVTVAAAVTDMRRAFAAVTAVVTAALRQLISTVRVELGPA